MLHTRGRHRESPDSGNTRTSPRVRIETGVGEEGRSVSPAHFAHCPHRFESGLSKTPISTIGIIVP